jgi:hypothetical protein
MAIPRIVYFTAKRFASLIGFIAGGLAIGIGVVYLAYLSEQAFGSAIPAIAAIGLGMFVFLSYVSLGTTCRMNSANKNVCSTNSRRIDHDLSRICLARYVGDQCDDANL